MNFDFLDELIPNKPRAEESIKAKASRLKEELDSFEKTAEEKISEAEKGFSKMDMEVILYSDMKRTHPYECVIFSPKGQSVVLSQDQFPLLFHKDTHNITREIALALNGRVMRSDKAMKQLINVGFPEGGKVILVHKAKSAQQILNDQYLKASKEKVENERIESVSLQYNTKRVKTYPAMGFPEREEIIAELRKRDREQIIAQPEDFKYLVFPTKYLYNTGDLEVQKAIGVMERAVNKERAKENKPPITANKYIVINQDEPYADEIWSIMLRGEDIKNHQ